MDSPVVETRLMRAEAFAEPLAQPGQVVRWRHPRRACALGLFNVFGPGPFEVVGVVDERDQDRPLAFIIQTQSGEKEINAAWVGLPAKRSAPPGTTQCPTCP